MFIRLALLALCFTMSSCAYLALFQKTENKPTHPCEQKAKSASSFENILIVAACEKQSVQIAEKWEDKIIRRTLGTGFVINKNGLIASAAHPLDKEDSNSLCIYKYNKEDDKVVQKKAVVKAISKKDDVVILKVDHEFQSSFELGTGNPSVGACIYMVGYTQYNGLEPISVFGNHLTRDFPVRIPKYEIDLGVDVSNPIAVEGMTGSPVFNESGKVVGIVISAFVTTHGDKTSSKVTMSAPVNALKKLLAQIK